MGRLNTDPVDVVRVLDVQCTAKRSSNPFGQLTGGRVKLRGPVVWRVLTAAGDETSSGSLVIECGGCVSTVCLDRMEEVDKYLGMQVYCLKMRTDSFALNRDSKHYDTSREDDRHRWIVLVRKQDGPEEIYERVGIVEHMEGEGADGERDVCIV